jgi:hypothetical protein
VKATDFQVMGVMSARNLDIRMSDQIVRLQRTRQGTQVTVGIGCDAMAVSTGRLIGALYLIDNAQFEAVRSELEGMPEPPTVEERDELSRRLTEAETLLRACYDALTREGWETGDSMAECASKVGDYIANRDTEAAIEKAARS